jgi:formylglycine-generating enzyme required for sulfatase activity
MDWTFVGDPGNACDVQPQGCFGAVDYAYQIGTYEVTNGQYAEFLNAKAASDPLHLYGGFAMFGIIDRSGSPGNYIYTVDTAWADHPVMSISLYDAMRFANWLHNGQRDGDTETGSYTLLGNSEIPTNGATVTRNQNATIVLPNEAEWYKAAYYDAVHATYFDYPAGSDVETVCASPTATPNRANCLFGVTNTTPIGSYPGAPSPYGTFDQGGNAYERTETSDVGGRVVRGGAYMLSYYWLAAENRVVDDPSENNFIGFRVANVPEPSSGAMLTIGLLGFAIGRRARV